jgi:ubiquinol-cytochrome c reductase cytochrome c subunit
MNLSPEEKNDIITYIEYVENNPSVGGFQPRQYRAGCRRALFVWIIGLGVLIAITIWLTARAH